MRKFINHRVKFEASNMKLAFLTLLALFAVSTSVWAGTPPNDLCQDAEDLDVPSTTGGTTLGATFDDVGFCGTANTAPGVWYTVVGTGNTMTISTYENNSSGSANYDTKLSVFCDDCDDLLCVAGNDDEPGCNFHSTASWCSQAGETYHILVHGFGSATGNFDLAVLDDGTLVKGL